jgi:hypothetical protein
MSMRVASFFPFQATYYLNGHNFIERELNREQVTFRNNDNAFLAVSGVAALQKAAGRFTAGVIQKRLDYGTLRLGPGLSQRERAARMTANRISGIFGSRITKKLKGKLNTTLEWNRPTTVITFSGRTGRTHSSNNTRSSPRSCAMKSAPTTSRTSALRKASASWRR